MLDIAYDNISKFQKKFHFSNFFPFQRHEMLSNVVVDEIYRMALNRADF